MLVGLANLVIYVYVGSSEALLGDDAGGELRWSALLALTLYAIVVGLLTAEILLKSLESALTRNFSTRYAATVLGFCIGGVFKLPPLDHPDPVLRDADHAGGGIDP